MATIVVGIDGSEHSKAALRWAIDEAQLRDAEVEAVYAFEYTPSWSMYAYGESDLLTKEDVEVARAALEVSHEQARKRAEALLDRVIAEAAPPANVTVRPMAIEDRRPARALVEQSQSAQMLVVGSRGRGGFTGLVLGSVSQQSAHHARCPIVIIGHVD